MCGNRSDHSSSSFLICHPRHRSEILAQICSNFISATFTMGNPNPIFEMNIGSFGNIFQRKQQDLPERDAAGLPYTIKENIDTLTREYEDAAQHGGRESIEKCFKYVVVHFRSFPDHIDRAPHNQRLSFARTVSPGHWFILTKNPMFTAAWS